MTTSQAATCFMTQGLSYWHCLGRRQMTILSPPYLRMTRGSRGRPPSTFAAKLVVSILFGEHLPPPKFMPTHLTRWWSCSLSQFTLPAGPDYVVVMNRLGPYGGIWSPRGFDYQAERHHLPLQQLQYLRHCLTRPQLQLCHPMLVLASREEMVLILLKCLY